MNRTMRYGVVVLLVIGSIFGCHSEDVKSVVRGNDVFTANTYKELAKTSGDKNIIVSGLSAEVILSLLANGAKGETLKQILSGLSLPEQLEVTNKAYGEILAHLNVNTENLKLLSANKIFPAEGFTVAKKFDDTAVNVYHSGVQNIDYKNPEVAANTINQWVEDQTNKKIKNLIKADSLSASTALVLVNALYFSGTWQDTFEKYQTKKRVFYTSATDSKEIESMHTETHAKYSYSETLKAKFLELQFLGGNVSMTFVLPDSRTGLGAVEQNLENYLEPQTMENAKIAVTLPKFTINTEIDFKPILQSFGIDKMFTSEADLSGISDAAPLKVDFVLQKAFIDVNEDGVEAAAATAVGMDGAFFQIPKPPKYSFNADHPFFFYIRENNFGTTIFAGRFNNISQ